MTLPNIFTKDVSESVIERIEQLHHEAAPNWGKMNSAQMLAHCNVNYEILFEDKHPKPNALVKFFLKKFVKNKVVSTAPYVRNSPTAPAFVIKGAKNFRLEKNRLIDFINKTQLLGEPHFDNRESVAFGVLSKEEWNNLFYKHLDHHLSQFVV